MFRFITSLFDPFVTASRIKQDPDLRQRSVRLGVMSIVYSLLAAAFAVGGLFVCKFAMDGGGGLLFIFVLIIGIALMIAALMTYVGGLLRLIAQFSVNRRAVGWIALVVLLAVIIAAVIVALQL